MLGYVERVANGIAQILYTFAENVKFYVLSGLEVQCTHIQLIGIWFVLVQASATSGVEAESSVKFMRRKGW